jgi:hypothetical protein
MIKPAAKLRSFRRPVAIGLATFGLALGTSLAATAQSPAEAPAGPLADLRACRALASESERLACYDAKVDVLLGAEDAGDVRVIDREEARQTRRKLFGLPLPDIRIFKADDKDEATESSDLFETTIASARQLGKGSWRFTTAEGAVWEINNPPRRLAPIEAGDKVVFKRASLGYFFIRINGQLGVKGRRVS